MIDEFSIQQVLNCFSEAASRSDWDQVITTFAADGTWEIPLFNIKFEGHQAVREALVGFTAQYDYVFQLNAPAQIKVDGDTATARSVVRESAKYADRDEAVEILMFYSDKLVRTPAGWKLKQRISEVRAMQNMQLLPAATQ